jgi:alpha-glucuronidase
MINHWDNGDGSVERGYAGRSIFFKDYRFMPDTGRIRDYARLLACVGINAVSINNVNVHFNETKFITPEYLPDVARYAAVFRRYGIRLFLCVNFAAPIQLAGLPVSDPLDERVRDFWPKPPGRSMRPCRTSAGSWSRPTPKAGRGRLPTGAPTPTGPICWPGRWRPTAGL